MHHPAYVFGERITSATVACDGGILFECPISREVYSFAPNVVPLNKSDVWGNCGHTQVGIGRELESIRSAFCFCPRTFVALRALMQLYFLQIRLTGSY